MPRRISGAVGTVAGLTYLEPSPCRRPPIRKCSSCCCASSALTDQVDDLRRRQPSMTPEQYDQEFEKLIIELALVSRDVRQRTGG